MKHYFTSIFDTMVYFAILAAALLAVFPSALAAPSGLTTRINHETVGKQLQARQGGYYSFWSEGGGSFNCNQQGGGKYSCNWSGQKGGGFVAGTGFNPGGSRYASQSLVSLLTVLIWTQSCKILRHL